MVRVRALRIRNAQAVMATVASALPLLEKIELAAAVILLAKAAILEAEDLARIRLGRLGHMAAAKLLEKIELAAAAKLLAKAATLEAEALARIRLGHMAAAAKFVQISRAVNVLFSRKNSVISLVMQSLI